MHQNAVQVLCGNGLSDLLQATSIFPCTQDVSTRVILKDDINME